MKSVGQEQGEMLCPVGEATSTGECAMHDFCVKRLMTASGVWVGEPGVVLALLEHF